LKLFTDIASHLGLSPLSERDDNKISDLRLDSRKVQPGDLFIAIKGTHADGHDYIASAIESGASVVLAEHSPSGSTCDTSRIYVLPDLQDRVADLCKYFYDNPAAELSLIGVTGTNGKTTVASSLYALLSDLNLPSGLISTIDIRYADKVIDAELTTPSVVDLYRILAEMRAANITQVVMEVSSHALVQGRVDGVDFSIAVFTNISRDHLDYHETFRNYIDAKKLLFDQLSSDAVALINQDEKHASYLMQNSAASLRGYSLRSLTDYKGKIMDLDGAGMRLQINSTEFISRMTGRFNAYNLLAIYGVAMELGCKQEEVLLSLSKLAPPRGRLEQITSASGIYAYVDYAHTPDALSNVLTTLRELRGADAQIYCVIGCGGDRDKGKRPQMAEVACRLSDVALLTSDNPRSEDPWQILKDMTTGLTHDNYRVIVDREDAIDRAVNLAEPGDFILVAGKGHETYQIIGDERIDFDDAEVLNNKLNNKN